MWAAVLVIANRSGGAQREEMSERTGCEQKRERAREGARSGREGGRRGEPCSYGSRYRERSKHCKSISRRLPALRTRPVFQHANTYIGTCTLHRAAGCLNTRRRYEGGGD